MKKIGTILAVLVLAGVLVRPGIPGFISIIIIFMYGLISFPYRHLSAQSKNSGQWRVNWSEFRQQLFLNSIFLLLFIPFLIAKGLSAKKMLIVAAAVLIIIAYSLLMGLHKGIPSSKTT